MVDVLALHQDAETERARLDNVVLPEGTYTLRFTGKSRIMNGVKNDKEWCMLFLTLAPVEYLDGDEPEGMSSKRVDYLYNTSFRITDKPVAGVETDNPHVHSAIRFINFALRQLGNVSKDEKEEFKSKFQNLPEPGPIMTYNSEVLENFTDLSSYVECLEGLMIKANVVAKSYVNRDGETKYSYQIVTK